jgi:hypothetical protein
MKNKDAFVIKALAELGIDVTPKEKTNSPDLEKVKARLDDFTKEVGSKLNPEDVAAYLKYLD